MVLRSSQLFFRNRLQSHPSFLPVGSFPMVSPLGRCRRREAAPGGWRDTGGPERYGGAASEGRWRSGGAEASTAARLRLALSGLPSRSSAEMSGRVSEDARGAVKSSAVLVAAGRVRSSAGLVRFCCCRRRRCCLGLLDAEAEKRLWLRARSLSRLGRALPPSG